MVRNKKYCGLLKKTGNMRKTNKQYNSGVLAANAYSMTQPGSPFAASPGLTSGDRNHRGRVPIIKMEI